MKNKIKTYSSIVRMGIIEALSFKVSYILTCIGNFIYFIVIYFLWTTIYSSNEIQSINGMSLEHTITYLVLATAIYRMLDCFLVPNIDNDIKSGRISLDLLRPISYPIFMFFKMLGSVVITCVSTFIPVFFLLFFSRNIKVNIGDFFLFVISIVLAIVLNYLIDFFVAILCFYTQSGWGLNILKQVIIQIISGIIIPIAFMPEYIQRVVICLPFQAIYNLPLQFITNPYYDVKSIYTHQIVWIIIMIIVDWIMWKKSMAVLIINGG